MNLTQVGKLVRFTQQANLLGLPAIVLPLAPADGAGGGMPASVQLIGQQWHDAALLRAAAALEAALAAEGLAPPLPGVLANPLAAREAPRKRACGSGNGGRTSK